MELIKSISYNQHEIIRWILELHCKTDIQLDPTYSKGMFYKDDSGINPPKFRFDIAPIPGTGTIKASADNLPMKYNSIDTMIFDPPFLATKGPSLKKDKGNLSVKRFGHFETEKELFIFYKNSLIEFYRILKEKGILIFKCQDKISSGKQIISHNIIINMAEELGFYTKDMFVLLAKSRLVPNWQLKNQKNARKFHSYFVVFEKSKRTNGIKVQ